MADTVTDWPALRSFALGLGLPEVIEATSWGEPCLKAHGKLWTWWSPSAHCPVFKAGFEEREFLLDMRSDTFFITPHYRSHRLVLMRPEVFDAEWAEANLRRVWRDQAPKRFLKAWDAQNGGETDGAG
ncbi:MmcQ/YjbR family DNA-binding protein [Oricola sp.]|uniref:MmcQ/YjbR family DNA-binding protein n=1 Tax=Oricola sp. TaxID=1979950 RepID=UPI003BACAE46